MSWSISWWWRGVILAVCVSQRNLKICTRIRMHFILCKFYLDKGFIFPNSHQINPLILLYINYRKVKIPQIRNVCVFFHFVFQSTSSIYKYYIYVSIIWFHILRYNWEKLTLRISELDSVLLMTGYRIWLKPPNFSVPKFSYLLMEITTPSPVDPGNINPVDPGNINPDWSW